PASAKRNVPSHILTYRPLPPEMDPSPSKPNLLERLSSLLMREPEDREQLLNLLHGAYERSLLDADALSIIEGALAVSDIQVRDIMVPRAQMDIVEIKDDPEKIAAFVIAATHSRFPAFDEHKDDVIVILLAKDLLNCFVVGEF